MLNPILSLRAPNALLIEYMKDDLLPVKQDQWSYTATKTSARKKVKRARSKAKRALSKRLLKEDAAQDV